MLAFKPIEAENLTALSQYFKCQNFRTCDYSIAGIFMWRKFFYSEYAIYENMLLFKVTYINGAIAFTFPIGCGSTDDALGQLEDYARQEKIPLSFCTVPQDGLAILEKRYGGKITHTENRDWFDYLYFRADMQTFAGRRFSGQRNHINKFKKLYPDYRYVPINMKNIGRVIEFFGSYAEEHVKENPIAKEESFRAKEILPYFEQFGLLGGFIEVEGKIVAFSVGEIVGDTLFVHIEKALKEYEGSYQMMVKEFAVHEANEEVCYINREEDIGDLGLRTSKLSYHPVRLLEKYFVTVEAPAWI
nr:phosphatidylglycerol lysyltransferase domain-containing protein [uncultured Caproiciproducens sp.]